MTKKLFEIAEIKSLSANTKLNENDILLSRVGKKVVRLSKNDISEYQNKNTYFVISSSAEYVDAIYKSLTSTEFTAWFNNTAKGAAQPTITLVDLKVHGHDGGGSQTGIRR